MGACDGFKTEKNGNDQTHQVASKNGRRTMARLMLWLGVCAQVQVLLKIPSSKGKLECNRKLMMVRNLYWRCVLAG